MADFALHSTHSTLRERIVEHIFIGDGTLTFADRLSADSAFFTIVALS